MRNFSENHIFKIRKNLPWGKNNYMKFSGRKSWILEFDLFLIIYLNFNNVAYLCKVYHMNIHVQQLLINKLCYFET